MTATRSRSATGLTPLSDSLPLWIRDASLITLRKVGLIAASAVVIAGEGGVTTPLIGCYPCRVLLVRPEPAHPSRLAEYGLGDRPSLGTTARGAATSEAGLRCTPGTSPHP